MKNIIYVFLAVILLATSIASANDLMFPIVVPYRSSLENQKLLEGIRNQQIQNRYLAKILQEELKKAKLQNEMYERELQKQSKPILTNRSVKPYIKNSSRGGVHYVKPYFKKNGKYVQGHLAGNPGSGVHCHKNVCY